MELLVELDRAGSEPLHHQLERSLRAAVRDGRLPPASPLPSSRALAGQLRVSRGIVVEAYEQLVAEGYLASRPGGATRVARPATAAVPTARRVVEPAAVVHDFRPGRPDVTEFPRAVWLRSLRRVLADAPSDRLTYLGGRGVLELGIALAAYLNRVRGTAANPSDVIVCTGFAQGLALTARALRDRGARAIAVEDPSDPEYRATIREAGLHWIGIPVDDGGLNVERLAASPADAVVVTAAHQYPTGAVLPPDRRAALLEWAVRRGGTIIEDDYDAEFRYDREPIGVIQGLAPERVVYAGSASKILAPGLRLGWLVAPPTLVESIVAIKQAADMGSAALDQLAFADMIDRGELDHHLRRMRPIYRRRRDALLAALARHLPDLKPVGASAGLHVLAWLPPDVDEATVLRAAEQAGVGLTGVATRRIEPGPGGLIFGYGGIAETAIEAGTRRLAAVIAASRTVGGSGGRRRESARLGAMTTSRTASPIPSPTPSPTALAVYGTLRRGEPNDSLLSRARYLGTGRIAGRMSEMPRTAEREYAYPSLILDGSGEVVIELYELTDPALLDAADALEAYDPADVAGSEYVRRLVPVIDGPVASAWVYVYNGPRDAMGEPIPGGDWVAHRARAGE